MMLGTYYISVRHGLESDSAPKVSYQLLYNVSARVYLCNFSTSLTLVNSLIWALGQ